MKNRLCLAALALGLCGCTTGSHCRVTAPSVPRPVSCTSRVLDAAGRTLGPDDLQLVRPVTLTRTQWSLFWTWVPLGRREWDLSRALNAQLQETSGDAVINVTVTSRTCDRFHGFVAALLPIIPSYAHFQVDADVVRLKP